MGALEAIAACIILPDGQVQLVLEGAQVAVGGAHADGAVAGDFAGLEATRVLVEEALHLEQTSGSIPLDALGQAEYLAKSRLAPVPCKGPNDKDWERPAPPNTTQRSPSCQPLVRNDSPKRGVRL